MKKKKHNLRFNDFIKCAYPMRWGIFFSFNFQFKHQ